jgi:hypothetical protein
MIVSVATMTIESLRVKMFSDELQKAVATRLEEIERTAADAIMRGPLPRSYYEHVKRLMLLKQILRSNSELRMVLTPVSNERFELLFDQSYTVRNLSGLEQSWSLECHESTDGQYGERTRIRFVRARFERAAALEVDEVAPEGGTAGVKGNGEIVFARPIRIPPGAGLVVEMGSVGWVRGNDLFYVPARDPGEGIRCVVDHPESVEVECEFPEGPMPESAYIARTWTEGLRDGWRRSTWEYSFPIAPSTAVICYWSVRDKPSQG